MPGSFRYEMAERGHNLPAGRRQLIALAAPAWWTPILLLDETTAALDLAAEAAVNRATEWLTARRTTVVVARRRAVRPLSTYRRPHGAAPACTGSVRPGHRHRARHAFLNRRQPDWPCPVSSGGSRRGAHQGIVGLIGSPELMPEIAAVNWRTMSSGCRTWFAAVCHRRHAAGRARYWEPLPHRKV